jgi:hypothetical protein
MNPKKLFSLLIISLGIIIFSGCYKIAEQSSIYKLDVNFEITVLNNVGSPVIGDFIYYRMMKYTGYSNTVGNLEEGKNLSDNTGKIYLTFTCIIDPSEVVRLYGMLDGFDSSNLGLETIFYDDVEAASFDCEYALIDREITLYKN